MKFLLIILIFPSLIIFGQNVTITPNGITPVTSSSYPRLSYDEILLLPNAVQGDIAFDTTFKCLRVFDGTNWVCTYQSNSVSSVNLALIQSGGGTSNDVAKKIATDANGNIYIFGEFEGTVNFGGSVKTSVGYEDVFLCKYSKNGDLIWAKVAGGQFNEVASDIKVGTDGNIYVTGVFYSTINFGSISKTSAGQGDVFITKYDNNGNILWVQTIGGTSFDGANSLTIDSNNNIYVAGGYHISANIGGVTKTSLGYWDIFFVKLSSDGNFLLVKTAGGTDYDGVADIAVDNLGNIFITGYFFGTASWDNISKTSNGLSDFYLTKYNSSGNVQWVKNLGGISGDNGFDIAFDSSNDIFIVGGFREFMNFGITTKTSVGSDDVFILKYDTNGTPLWLQTLGDYGFERGNGITTDSQGNVYVTGYFSNTVNFCGSCKTSEGYYDTFVIKFSNNGIFRWIQANGGVDYDESNGICIDNNDNIYITGSFSNTCKFGSIVKTTNGNKDFFVARLQQYN